MAHGLSVCLSDREDDVSCKTAGQIEMPFDVRAWVGHSNQVLDEGPYPPRETGILGHPAVGILNKTMRRLIEFLRTLVFE